MRVSRRTRALWVAGFSIVAAAVLVLPASAGAAGLERFFLPSTPRSDQRPIAAGSDGRVWVALRGAMASVDRDGTATPHSTGGLTPTAITVGRDGAVWFIAGDLVARVTDAATTVVARGLVGAHAPAAGPDGALWIAVGEAGVLIRVGGDGSVRRVPVTPGMFVHSLAFGPDGTLWYDGSRPGENLVGRMSPAGALWSTQVFGNLGAGSPTLAVASDGTLWVAGGVSYRLISVTPAGQVDYHPINAEAEALTLAPDGTIWFLGSSVVGRRTADGALRFFRDPFGDETDCELFASVGPSWTLTVAADGTVWVPYLDGALDRLSAGVAAPAPVRVVVRARGTIKAPNAMVRATDGSAWIATPRHLFRFTASGSRGQFRAWPGRQSVGMAPAADGGVWLSSRAGLSRVSPSGHVRAFKHQLPRGSEPDALAPAPHGGVWYVDPARHEIGRMTAAGRVYRVRVGRRMHPFAIAATDDGRLWVTDTHHAIELINTRRQVHRFPRAGTAAVPAIVAAPDGGAWFTDFSARRVEHISSAGQIIRYRTHGHPTSIALGPDGAVWFTTVGDPTTPLFPQGVGPYPSAVKSRDVV